MAFDFSRLSLMRLFQSGASRSEVAPGRTVNPYHAVSIVCGAKACLAARALGDRRFLSREAPRLPLASCNRDECRCHYRHHEDRRRSARRSNDDSGVTSPWSGEERRHNRGRRATDLEAGR